ncbi:MAG: YfhO family protein, partial [Oscillospiraceae bacterium]|nr:YfhO family protein [Oscillospiraceae bacterium]
PLGFAVSENISRIRVGEPNIFITQNEMMKQASGISDNVFSSIQQSGNSNENLTESRAEYGVYTYYISDTSKRGIINHTYTNDTKRQVYIYLKSTRTPGSRPATVRVNGEEKKYEINRGITIDCGVVLEGQDINISFDVDAGTSGTFNLFVVGFDEEAFKKGYDILNGSALNITEFKDTKIKGTINIEKDGLLFTSIPYDRGWNLKINGKKTEINPLSEAEINDIAADGEEKPDPRQIKKITDAFVTAPISAGEHEIELYYITNGLIPGIIISLICAAILIFFSFYEKRKETKEKQKIIKNNVRI